MRVVHEYSHLGGAEILQVKFPERLCEINQVITSVRASRTKISREKTKKDQELFAPVDMNDQFKTAFNELGYQEVREPYTISIPGSSSTIAGAYKQVDFVKGNVMVEVQFGKYAFMFYD